MDESQRKAKAYWRYKNILSLLGLVVLLSYLFIIQFSVSASLKAFSLSLSGNFYVSFFIYLIILNLGYYLVSLPLDFYGSFILEHKFSLSNQNARDWFKDEMKKWLISIFLSLLLVEIFYAAARNFHDFWWVIASFIWLTFSILFAKIFPIFVIPLFYKSKPLESNELRDKVLGLAKRFGIKIMDAFEINFSRTTKKANAALVGWGDTKRIIMADNLIKEFTVDEIEVVLAHEMAHYKLNHIWKLISAGSVFTVLLFFILSRIVGPAASAFSADGPFDMAIFPAIYLIVVIYGFVTMPIQNAISRKLETDADITALKITGLKDAFTSLMKKLASKNLSDENPNILIEILLYDHPPIAKRIALAEKLIS